MFLGITIHKKLSLIKIILLYSLVTIIITFPWIFKIGEFIPGSWQTPGIIYLTKFIHGAVFSNISGILDPGYFFPLENPSTFAENLIGNFIFFSPIYFITKNLILSYNIMLFLFFIFSATSFYICANNWFRNAYASFIGGLIFSFTTYRFANIDDAHILNCIFFPLAIYFLDNAIKKNKWKYYVLFIICFLLQVLSALYIGFFLTLCILIYLAVHYKKLADRNTIIKLFSVSLLGLLLLSPLIIPYIQTKLSYPYTPWGNFNFCGLDLARGYLTVLSNNLFYGNILFNPGNEEIARFCAFPGFMVLLLCIAGIISKKFPTGIKPFVLILIGVAFVFSLGPYLRFNLTTVNVPLPYLIIFKFFTYIRCSWRFVFLLMFGVSLLATAGTVFLLNKIDTTKWIYISIVLSCMILAEHTNIPMKLYPVERPDMDLKSHIDGPVLNYPSNITHNVSHPNFLNWFKREFFYIYYQAYYDNKTVNGMLSYNPAPRFEINEMINLLPEDAAINYFSTIGVKYLLFHKNRFLNGEKIYSTDEFQVKGLSRIIESNNLALYRIEQKTDVSERINIEWNFITRPNKLNYLLLTLTPEKGTVWRNPLLSKKQNIRLGTKNSNSSNEERLSFHLPLVIDKQLKVELPILSRDIKDKDVELHNENNYFNLQKRKVLSE